MFSKMANPGQARAALAVRQPSASPSIAEAVRVPVCRGAASRCSVVVRTLHRRPHHLPHLPLHGLILCDPCHGALVRHGLPAFGISRRPRQTMAANPGCAAAIRPVIDLRKV
jgi:hypothetical protein